MIIVKINKYFNPKIKWSSPYKIMDFYKPTARFPSRKVLVGWVRHGAIGIRRHPYWINCFIGHMDVYRPLILMSVGFTAPHDGLFPRSHKRFDLPGSTAINQLKFGYPGRPVLNKTQCFIGHMDVYRPLILMSVGFTPTPPRWCGGLFPMSHKRFDLPGSTAINQLKLDIRVDLIGYIVVRPSYSWSRWARLIEARHATMLKDPFRSPHA